MNEGWQPRKCLQKAPASKGKFYLLSAICGLSFQQIVTKDTWALNNGLLLDIFRCTAWPWWPQQDGLDQQLKILSHSCASLPHQICRWLLPCAPDGLVQRGQSCRILGGSSGMILCRCSVHTFHTLCLKLPNCSNGHQLQPELTPSMPRYPSGKRSQQCHIHQAKEVSIRSYLAC